jgi:hypothetical protein
MAYVLNWSDIVKGTIILNPLAVDTTSTSITLFGKGAPNYGEGQQEGILKILENFASPNPPPHPTHGQIWFNTGDRVPYIYDTNNTWKPIGGICVVSPTAPTNVVTGLLWWDSDDEIMWVWDGSAWKKVSSNFVAVAYLEEYNSLVDLYNQIAGTPTGPLSSGCSTVFGYGQNNLPHLTSMTNLDWINLLNKFRNIANHQGVSSANISTRGFIYDHTSNIQCGITTLLNEFNNTQININDLFTTRFQATSLESSNAGGFHQSTSVWGTTKYHEVFIQFTNANHMKAFFNSGGRIQITPDLNPTPPPDPINLAYDALLASIGTITISACNTTASLMSGVGVQGFYNMTTSYQTYFEAHVGGNPLDNGYKVQCKIENGKDIRVYIEFDMTNMYYYSGIDGTITSDVTQVKASELYLNDPEIAFATMSSTSNI